MDPLVRGGRLLVLRSDLLVLADPFASAHHVLAHRACGCLGEHRCAEARGGLRELVHVQVAVAGRLLRELRDPRRRLAVRRRGLVELRKLAEAAHRRGLIILADPPKNLVGLKLVV